MAECTGVIFDLPQKIPNFYGTLSFCTWYAIAVLVPGYNVNYTCIKDIKALNNTRKSSMKTHLRGMDEFLEAESEASRMEVAAITEPEEEEVKEPLIRHP